MASYPKCTRCSGKLTKNKKLKAYYCRRHGFVRKIVPIYQMITQVGR